MSKTKRMASNSTIVDDQLLQPSNGFVPSLNGLRAVSLAIVLVSHFNLEKFVPGGFGVAIFFFISGFLITRLLLAEYNDRGSIDITMFLVRRFLRLYPPLIIMIVVLIAANNYIGIDYSSNAIVASLLYYANYFRVYHGYELSYTALSHTWSLAVEEHFYIVYPLILLFILRSRGPLASLLAAGCCLALALRIFIHFSFPGDAGNYIYNASETRMDFLLAGCLSTTLCAGAHARRYVSFIQNRSLQNLAVCLILVSFVVRNELFRDTFRYTFQVAAFLVLIPNLVFGSGFSTVKFLLNNRFFDYIGRISYDLYLFHIPIFFFIEKAFLHYGLAGPAWTFNLYATGTLMSVAAAAASYKFIETPLREVRKRLHARRNTPGVGGAVARTLP